MKGSSYINLCINNTKDCSKVSVFNAITRLVCIQSSTTGLINPFQVKTSMLKYQYLLNFFFSFKKTCDNTNSAHDLCIKCLPDSATVILISALLVCKNGHSSHFGNFFFSNDKIRK